MSSVGPYMMPSNIIHLVLCTMTVCFFVGSHAIPVVFPSFTTKGFANLTNTGDLVSIPAAFEHLLCKTSEEFVNFAWANKSCSSIVFFTSNRSLTLNFLNLSSNGTIQPLRMTPQIRSSHSSLNLSWNIPYDPDNDRTCGTDNTETQDPAEGTSRNQFEQRSEDENLDTNGEDNNEVQLRQLRQDASGEAVSTADEHVPSEVDQAKESSGFIYPNGTVMPNYSFVVQLHLEELPQRELIALEFGFEDNITRFLMFYVDASSVSVNIECYKVRKNDSDEGRVRYMVLVTFTPGIVSRANETDLTCPDVTKPLDSFIAAAQFKDGQHHLNPSHLWAVVNASKAPSTCPELQKELNVTSWIHPGVDNATFSVEDTGLAVCRQTNEETLWKTVVQANFSYGEDQTSNISVKVDGAAVASLSGMPIQEAAKTFNLSNVPVLPPETSPLPSSSSSPPPSSSSSPPPSSSSSPPPSSSPSPGPDPSVQTTGIRDSSNDDSVAAMRTLGTTVSSLTGAAAGFSFIASVGVPFLIFFNPAGGTALMSELGCLSSVVDLMQLGQRAYLLTKLKVPNLPESFIAFGEQFSWTMLNIRAPWVTESDSDNATDTPQSSRRRLLDNDTKSEDENSQGDPYSKLRDTYFWTGIALVSLGILHCVLLAIFIRYRNNVPSILRLPRLELYLIQSCIAIVVQGPAYLFGGSTRQIIIGVLVLTLGIIPMACWHYYVVHKYLFDERREEKRIVYALGSVDMSEHGRNSVHTHETTNGTTSESLLGGVSVRRVPRENIHREGDQSWFSKHVVSVLLGPLYRSGEWTWRDGQAVRVIDRFGPFFEDYRGKPVHIIHVQQEDADETEGQWRKFEEVQPENRYPIDVPNRSFVLRISEKIINLGTTVFVTLLILGDDDPEREYQAALLLSIQVVYVIYLRVFRPHCSRWKLGVALFEKALDAMSMFLVVWKLNIGHSTSRDDIGVVMAILEATAIAMQLIDIVLTVVPMIKKVKEAFWYDELEERTPSLVTVFMRHPNMAIGFEEMMFDNPREAISVKIIQPLTTSFESARRRRRHQPVTDSNHSRESIQNGSSTHNHAEAEQTTE